MGIFSGIFRFFGWSSTTTSSEGIQDIAPRTMLTQSASPDAAMQLSTVYACTRVLANSIASLPLMVYKTDKDGNRIVDRSSTLYHVLHNQPNEFMTAFEFWSAMVSQLCLRGNAYAHITRDKDGNVTRLYPLASDQVTVVKKGNTLKYVYRTPHGTETFSDYNILHLKDIGLGIVGYSKIDFMNASVNESIACQQFSTDAALDAGLPKGVVSADHILKKRQREAIKNNLFSLKRGRAKIAVLEAGFKFQQIALTPRQAQLLETRKYSVERICRWFNVPPVLIGASGTTAWGSGIAELISFFHKFTIAPELEKFEQAMMKQLVPPLQKGFITIEFNCDGFLRSDIQTRYGAYATAVQNGFMTRNEVRQLENLPMDPNAYDLTAQVNLSPLSKLGSTEQAEDVSSTQGVIKQ